VKCEIHKCEKNENKKNGKKNYLKKKFDNWPKHYISRVSIRSYKSLPLYIASGSYMYNNLIDTFIGWLQQVGY